MPALLLLLKLGMDTYTCNRPTDEAIEALVRIPNAVLDGVIVKVAAAAAKGGRDGITDANQQRAAKTG